MIIIYLGKCLHSRTFDFCARMERGESIEGSASKPISVWNFPKKNLRLWEETANPWLSCPAWHCPFLREAEQGKPWPAPGGGKDEGWAGLAVTVTGGSTTQEIDRFQHRHLLTPVFVVPAGQNTGALLSSPLQPTRALPDCPRQFPAAGLARLC